MLSITDVNETMCRMSGYSRSELIGSAFQQYFTSPKYAAAGVRLTLDKGAVTNYLYISCIIMQPQLPMQLVHFYFISFLSLTRLHLNT